MKKWYTSKTLYVNAIALIALILQLVNGAEVLDIELQVAILALVNIALRVITNKPINWK